MSVHFWGERPAGTWKLQVENTGSLLNRGKSTVVLIDFVVFFSMVSSASEKKLFRLLCIATKR